MRQVEGHPVTALCCRVGMSEHSVYVVKLRRVAGKKGELNWEQHFADDPQWFPVCQTVQRRRNPTFDGVLDRHQRCCNLTIAYGLESLRNCRVRGGLFG